MGVMPHNYPLFFNSIQRKKTILTCMNFDDPFFIL